MKYKWINKCEEAFQELNRRLTSAPVLALATNGEDFVLYNYAFKNRLGCVLSKIIVS